MASQHIGQHSPALTTQPQDQQGQRRFHFAPKSQLLSPDEGESAGVFLKKISPIFSSHAQSLDVSLSSAPP